MSQKKINKIKASSIHNTQPKKDPISTTIIREEDDPDKDIGYKWIPYFRDSDNVYVNDLAKRARRSSTHNSIINQKQTFAMGKAFTFKVDGEEVSFEELPDDFKEWYGEVNSEGEDLRDVFSQWMNSYIITGNCYPHIKKSGEFTALFSEDATTVRKSKDKKTAYLSNFWRDIAMGTTTTYDYPIDTLSFYDGTERKEYLIHICRKFLEFNYYGLPDYVGALNWIDIEYKMPKYNLDKFDNGFFPSALIQTFGELPDGLTAQQYVQLYIDKFTGEGNNSKIVVEALDSPEQAANIHEFDREKDGEFTMLSQLAIDAIVTAHRITPSLAGLETAGKLGSNQQLQNEYEKFMNSVIIPDFQEPLLRVLNRVIKRDTKWNNIEVGILNVSPVGNAERIDINAITTINEGREIAGLKPFDDGDVRGDLFINQNSVENIDSKEEKEEGEE